MNRVRTVFTATALAVTVLTAASCIASSGQTASPPSEPDSPTPTPVAYTREQLRAALPSKATLRKRYEKVGGVDSKTVALFCGDLGTTVPDASSRVAILAQSPRKAGGWNVFTSVVMSGLVFPDGQAADDFVTRARTSAKRCDGKINRDPVKVGDGYRPGEKGRGAISAATAEEWEGFRLVTVTRWSFPERGAGPSMVHGSVIVMAGNAVFVVSAVRPDDNPKVVTRTLDRWASRLTREVG